jgi:hypothetical protein
MQVPELAARVHVAERRASRTARRPRGGRGIVLGATAALELYDGHGVERLQLPTNRRRWQSSPPAPTSQGETARKAHGTIRRLAGGPEAVCLKNAPVFPCRGGGGHGGDIRPGDEYGKGMHAEHGELCPSKGGGSERGVELVPSFPRWAAARTRLCVLMVL